ncbi:hypothetical protein BH10BAC2_BH10BAC2_09840 [soil metagenome]
MQPENLEFWIDLNLPPSLAEWIASEFKVKAKSFKELGFEYTSDADVFKLAHQHKDVIVITTKDIDFFYLSGQANDTRLKILHINTVNISNKHLKLVLGQKFKEVIRIFTQTNQILVEITEFL